MGVRSLMSAMVRAQSIEITIFALALVGAAPVPAFNQCIDFIVPKANVTKTVRGTAPDIDPGWGVDLMFSGRDPSGDQTVHTTIWDDDGDGFFQVQVGDAYCKVDSGSNGLAPGATAEVFEQAGLKCSLTQIRAHLDGSSCFKFKISLNETHAADCVTPEAHRDPKGDCPPPVRPTGVLQ